VERVQGEVEHELVGRGERADEDKVQVDGRFGEDQVRGQGVDLAWGVSA
jgi:hypothetical protein